MKYYFALLYFIALTIPVLAQQKMYIKIDGIDGESKDPKHLNWTDAYAYSVGMARDVGWGGTGTTAGKVNFGEYTFTICLDKSVNPMKVKFATGQFFTTVKVDFVKNDNYGTPYIYSQILLENVIGTSINEGASTDINKININVSFHFDKVTCTYYYPNQQGLLFNQFKWDVVKGQPF